MKLKLVKHYVQNKIKDIEGEIYDHQFVIDFDNPYEEELKHRQWAIKELMIDLEAYRHYLNLLNSGEAPTIEVVKHSGIDHIKSLYFSDGWYVINEWSVCSECKHDIDDFGQNFCSECGAKLDGEHRFFRKKTTFVEGENALVPISHTEYKCAEDWEYEID